MSLIDPLLALGPLWLVGLIVIALCLLAREAGSLLFRFLGKRKLAPGNYNKQGDEAGGSDVGTVFGLLAFVLAFTFSIALDRFDTRRSLVGEEANAIGTTYRRAELFDEPDRSLMQQTLRAYAHTRIAPPDSSDREVEARARYSRALREQFWTEARVAILPVRDTERGSYFVESVNEMLEVGDRREYAGRAHVPSRILDATLLYLLISAGMLGYARSEKGGGRLGSTVLLILFVLVIMLVLDIDHPRSGSIMVPQRAIEDLVASLNRDEARNAAAPSLRIPVGEP